MRWTCMSGAAGSAAAFAAARQGAPCSGSLHSSRPARPHGGGTPHERPLALRTPGPRKAGGSDSPGPVRVSPAGVYRWSVDTPDNL